MVVQLTNAGYMRMRFLERKKKREKEVIVNAKDTRIVFSSFPESVQNYSWVGKVGECGGGGGKMGQYPRFHAI